MVVKELDKGIPSGILRFTVEVPDSTRSGRRKEGGVGRFGKAYSRVGVSGKNGGWSDVVYDR